MITTGRYTMAVGGFIPMSTDQSSTGSTHVRTMYRSTHRYHLYCPIYLYSKTHFILTSIMDIPNFHENGWMRYISKNKFLSFWVWDSLYDHVNKKFRNWKEKNIFLYCELGKIVTSLNHSEIVRKWSSHNFKRYFMFV